MRRRKNAAEPPGQDSFLDIVANLVGILIILVMVIGARARDTFLEITPALEENAAQEQKLQESAATAKRTGAAITADIDLMTQTLGRQDIEINYRRKERDKILQVTLAMESELQDREAQLDATQRSSYELNASTQAAKEELRDLERGIATSESAAGQAGVIDHLPTPMAKTVFGRELHFRLKDNRLAYVPWDELLDQFKSDAPRKRWKLKQTSRLMEIIGPVRGFRMKYTIVRVSRPEQTQAGVLMRERIELDNFELTPVASQLGDSLEDAFQPNSRLSQALRGLDPKRTTITVWVYPASFASFRQLKTELFRRGFLTAARPLPEGHPIGGSPSGTRSAAQ